MVRTVVAFVDGDFSSRRAVSHPNLIRYYGAAYKGDNLYMVTELMEAGAFVEFVNVSPMRGSCCEKDR